MPITSLVPLSFVEIKGPPESPCVKKQAIKSVKSSQNHYDKLTLQAENPAVNGPAHKFVSCISPSSPNNFIARLQSPMSMRGRVTFCKTFGNTGILVFEIDPQPERIALP